MNGNHNSYARIITGTLLLGIGIACIWLPPLFFSTILTLIAAEILLFEWPRLIKPTAMWLVTPLYPITPFMMLIALNHQADYRYLLLLLFVIVSCFDTGSYIAGNLFGYHKIAPTISPGKSWEGFFGGYLMALAAVYAFTWYYHTPFTIIIILITLLLCTISLAGDLFESWLKRRVHLKDSGSLLPGHGGFLDRFDGVMWVAVFVYAAKEWLITVF